MPHIAKEKRAGYDEFLDCIHPDHPGDLAYCIARLILHYMATQGLPCFSLFNEVAGVLSITQDEFYSRFIKPYEGAKASENGDAWVL